MTGVCVFPKICVNHRQADPVLVFLDMRASSLLLLTFIFTAAEYPLHIFGVNGKCEEPKQGNNYGNIPDNISYEENSKFRMPCVEGYLRKAGTSNLFRCQTNNTHGQLEWNNWPPLNCTPDPRKQRSTTVANKQTPITATNPTLSTLSSAEKPYFTTMGKTMDTSTTLGQTTFTTTHTVATTAETSQNTTLRTTTKEEEPMTTTDSVTLSSSSTLTDRENLTTMSLQSTSSSNTSTTVPTLKTSTNASTAIIPSSAIIPSTAILPSTTIIPSTAMIPSTAIIPSTNTITGPGKGDRLSSKAVGGIAAGTVLLLIVVAGSAAGIFILCRRQDVSSTAVEMRLPPGSDQPLLDTHTATLLTSCPDSAQNPKTDPLIVVQQA
uniref:Serine-rich adhesin for platelets-like n=1 Tax=Astyanax mexicanus TaxID=7994 RepID=A0A3B1J0C1_ASTMX